MSIKDDLMEVIVRMRIQPMDAMKMRSASCREVQDAMMALMDEGRIILSSDRYLEIPQKTLDIIPVNQ